MRSELLIDVECAFDSSGGNHQFNELVVGRACRFMNSSNSLLFLLKTTQLPKGSKKAERQSKPRHRLNARSGAMRGAGLEASCFDR